MIARTAKLAHTAGRAFAGRFRRVSGVGVATFAFAALLALPVVTVLLNVFELGQGTWQHLADTVLASYIHNTLGLALGVAAGVIVIGVATAWLTAVCDFPGRRFFEWALILPMAVPAYIMAYAYTDFFQFSGPFQTWLREAMGWGPREYWFPDVRSLGGAIAMLALVLYPYVYLLSRAAFLEQSAAMLEVGRSFGYGAWGSFFRIALPLARPGIVAGTALALMETLADFGTVAYFGIPTFTTGIYRTWFSLGDRVAAAQLSAILLGFVAAVLLLERWTRGRAGYHSQAPRKRIDQYYRLRGIRAAAAVLTCAAPIVLGFALPGAILLNLALTSGDAQFGARYVQLTLNTTMLAGVTALLGVLIALVHAYGARVTGSMWVINANRVAGLGYALPGIVIAVGVLIPVTRLDHALDMWMRDAFGIGTGLLFTGSIAALVYAYLVRFFSVALQTVDAGLTKVTRSMDEAARSLGLGSATVLTRVHAPLMWRSVFTAALLVFVEVAKELPATFVMRPFNFDTLAVQAFNLASDERLAEASTAALTILAVGVLPLIILSQTIIRSRRGS